MARETLPAALQLLFGDEGGYSNSKSDSGGPTKYGITHKTLAADRGVASVSAEQVMAMTLKEATDIYRKSYWSQSGGDLLPIGLDYAVFDFGVNSGPATAVKKLQDVLGIAQDGIIGVATVSAVSSYKGGLRKLIVDYCNRRMKYLQSLGGKTGFSANGRGWTIRVTGVDPKGQWKSTPGVVGNALSLVAKEPAWPTAVPDPAGSAKASQKDLSIVETIKKPEAWGPAAGLLTALTGLAAGTGPVQWALGAVMVLGVGYGIYRLVQRDRESA
ncbi:glycoside hydrolase family 108 protein [Phyllobacterium sp. LjRoot231]|uniref:glycoside hydrolase family 108 protein n=1 Tax=Phyllobacterium sp. LjRoot231 TaxID=3342289 RepID=UPI003ECD9990